MVATDLAAVQAEAAFMARAPVQVEEVFTVRAIRVTREVIIHNPANVISSNAQMSANAKGHSQRPIANSRPIEVSAMKDNTGTIARYHCANSTRNSETASTSSGFVRHWTCHMKNIAVQNSPGNAENEKKGRNAPH